MKPYLLTALLLAAPAAAAQTPSAPSIPATPPSSTAVPGRATSSTATPGTASTLTLRLTAQPGATVQLTSTVRTQITLEDLRLTGPGGQAASTAEAASLRADIQRGLNAASAQAAVSKTFYRVQGRAADGTVTLLTSTVTNMPEQPPLTVRVTQTVAPDGRTRVTRVESDNPQVQAALRGLPLDKLSAQGDMGSDLTGLYGQTFTVGQPRTQTGTLDAQALLGGVFGGMAASMGAGDALGNVKATPLTVRTTTTYRGTNASGQSVFDQRGSAGNWTVELGDLNSKTAAFHVKMELLDLTQSGQSLYRPDGLPAAQSMTQTLRMRATFTQPDGSQMQMTLRLNQNVQAR
ncbi:hypothetical protein Dcar01_03236 [Deinococcus carri]|uniref:Uncharacterized protein n=1 Tax=Deinococcus carri TaxID=1211323 RepID=A0ABP9WCM0_9DEIO